MSGILMPLAGKTISCVGSPNSWGTFYAYVDANGNPFSRITKIFGNDTGWVAGFSATSPNTSGEGDFSVVWKISPQPNLVGSGDLNNCNANWPMT